MNLAPEWLKGLWHKHPLVLIAVFAVMAAAVITVLVWPVTDLIAAHDVGLITGAQRAARLQTARASVRTQLLTLGAGVFAFGALVYTARNFTLARSTFNATETRVLNERFTTIASQLGDAQADVRLAGIHAMAGLADDWPQQRQTCVDVLCACLRMPYEPDPGDEAEGADQLVDAANREVRHTVIRVITAHLQDDERRAATLQDWRELNFDFTGVVFDGGVFENAQFTGGKVTFSGARFTGGMVSFSGARFTGDGMVSFSGARFTGDGTVSFSGAQFTGGSTVSFSGAQFTGGSTVSFFGARFTGGRVTFGDAQFTGGKVSFFSAQFTKGRVSFRGAHFTGGETGFDDARFTGGLVTFVGAEFSGGTVTFGDTHFTTGGKVSFSDARFIGDGTVSFGGAHFTGGEVDFSSVADWSRPPEFGWDDGPPPGVTLPNPGDS